MSENEENIDVQQFKNPFPERLDASLTAPVPDQEPEQTKPKTGFRITDEMVQASIRSVNFFTGNNGAFGAELAKTSPGAASVTEVSLGLVTFCVITLFNDFTITGQDHCLDPNLYDAKIGETYAYRDALRQIPQFLAYAYATNRFLGDMAKPASAELKSAAKSAEVEIGTYLCQNTVRAIPMTASAFAETYPDKVRPDHQSDDSPGYLVEYDGNYLSWSPKIAFDRGYVNTNFTNT